ncbi:MAG: hypothetical protein DCC67_06150 [Planctomycetota bacterium]|nr:MAG: hypothetical protein DCC67_06150 [Planctomycetota bacterium]
MPSQEPEITDALLDRLVDGELTAAERRAALAALESHGQWRRCALAFLEGQTLRADLRRIAAAAAPTVEAPLLRHSGDAMPENAKGVLARRGLRWGPWLALAASIVAAFGLGSIWRGASLPDSGARIASVDQGARKDAVAVQPPLAETSTGEALTLVVSDATGRPQRIRVPLVEGRALGRHFADTPEWSSAPELARQLGQRGLGLAARRRYAPLYFEQQNQVIPLIVPVDDAVITPVSRPVY